ncbi:serine/threonine-protein kinase [Gordonia caeni]|uniref:non-specific serine/threonine protein kinase n=1 Tax=Gordonia caeni TaxID=1007097 RepID=A0ABP7NIJ5_9ACTN
MNEMIAGYRVLAKLGDGGMGTVYLVAHPRLPRQEALKLVAPTLSSDPVYRARFAREADVLAQLDHPNIVRVHDRGETDGRLWLTMEYIDGPDAASLLQQQGRLPLTAVAEIVTGIAAALDYAWSTNRLAHRDVKPANILVRQVQGGPPVIKLADFGVATGPDQTQLTATGMAVGTLSYLAPESLGAAQVNDRSDQYSLACTAYHLLTGRPPFGEGSPATLMQAHLSEPPPVPSVLLPGLPPQVDAAIARATAKDPRDRFASSTAFAQALRAAPVPGPVPSGPPPVPRPGTQVLPPGHYDHPAAPPQPLVPVPPGPSQGPPPGPPPGPNFGGYAYGPPPATPPSSSRRTALVAGAVAAALLVVAVIVAGVFWLVRSGDSGEPAGIAGGSTSSQVSTTASSSTSSTSASSSSGTPAAPLSAIEGRWSGTYQCRQGESSVVFTIRSGLTDNQVRATFEFGPTPGNPGTERGSFEMLGLRLGDDVVFTPTRWIDRPGTYEMVPVTIDGPITTGMTRLTGRIVTPGCSTITVRR